MYVNFRRLHMAFRPGLGPIQSGNDGDHVAAAKKLYSKFAAERRLTCIAWLVHVALRTRSAIDIVHTFDVRP